MIICKPRSLASALLIAALPMGFALAGGAGGRGGAALGGGLGAEAWAVPALAAEHRREPLGVGPRPALWGADRRDRATRPATERLERATQAEMLAAPSEVAPMLHRG
jgi:hypothetical protein